MYLPILIFVYIGRLKFCNYIILYRSVTGLYKRIRRVKINFICDLQYKNLNIYNAILDVGIRFVFLPASRNNVIYILYIVPSASCTCYYINNNFR